MWVNDAQTLWMDRNRDTWQLPVMSCDEIYCGNVVAQVVEPVQCLVRYFVIFSHIDSRLYLLPSDSVSSLEGVLRCRHRAKALQKLPTYRERISLELERQISVLLSRSNT